MSSAKPTIAITIGDPAGVGPEISLKGLRDPALFARAHWKIIGDAALLSDEAKRCGLESVLSRVEVVDPHVDSSPLNGHAIIPGRLSKECGAAAVEYVRIATQMCLQGEADAMVTAPLNKEAVSLTGRHFSGHTEYIAELCGAPDSCMLLSNEKLSVVHVSTHISLRRATYLNAERILRTIELGNEAMRWMGHRQPRIAVCGLNPHAGEHGLFGTEDEDIIRPAIEAARAKGIACVGPTPPDTTFLEGVRGKHDLIVAMYHDQGHIPMKLIDFERTVNISLGIPIIRTSVDHGTAFDIAGQNKADARNMESALSKAISMAEGRIASRQGAME